MRNLKRKSASQANSNLSRTRVTMIARCVASASSKAVRTAEIAAKKEK
jgi:hypothetical protein